MKKNFIFAANWKMNLTLAEAQAYVQALAQDADSLIQLCDHYLKIDLFIPSLYLEKLQSLQREKFKVPFLTMGAQNISQFLKGAYTGECSAFMLQSIGISKTLIAHSERRQFFNDTENVIQSKIEMAFAHHMLPTVCIGEKLEDRQSGQYLNILKSQIDSIASIAAKYPQNALVIAYEPVWAIGTGVSADEATITETCHSIRKMLESSNIPSLQKSPLLYGGSVNPQNMKSIYQIPYVDGVLVGSASLQWESFKSLIQKSFV